MLTKYWFINFLLSLSMALCVGSVLSANAQENQIVSSVTANYEAVDGVKPNSQGSLFEAQIGGIQRTIVLQEKRTADRIKDLEAVIAEQLEIIDELRVDIKSVADKPLTNGTTFEVWSGILLGSVAVLVTVLGVGMALLSFIGYRELIEKGTESASLIAAEKTKEEFDRFIETGRLNGVVAESINKIMYRGISSGSEDNEGEDADSD